MSNLSAKKISVRMNSKGYERGAIDQNLNLKREKVVAKWLELFEIHMPNSALNHGIHQIKTSPVYGPSYTSVLVNLNKYFLKIHNFNKLNVDEAQKAKIFYQLCINTAVDRHRSRLHRKKVK